MYAKVPDGIPRQQWKEFVDIKNEEKYKVNDYYTNYFKYFSFTSV